MPIQGETFMTIALERPGASADGSTYSEVESLQNVKGNFPAPDLSAEYHRATSFGYVEIAGIARYIGWTDLDTDDGNDLSDNVLGWGVNLSSNIKFAQDKATARLGVVYGEGIQNYMNDATTDVAVQSTDDPDRPLEGVALPMLGASGFIDVQWNERFSSSIGYSMLQIDNVDDQSYTTFETGSYALANLLYYPAQNMMCGVELQYGARENKNGPEADLAGPEYLKDASAMRVQFSFKYNFGTTLYRKAN
jgi:hypothetical protein